MRPVKRQRPPARSGFRGAAAADAASRSRWCRALVTETTMVLSAKRRFGVLHPHPFQSPLPRRKLHRPLQLPSRMESMRPVKRLRPLVRSAFRGAMAMVVASRNRWYRALAMETTMGLSAKRPRGVLRLHRVPSPLPLPALTGSMRPVKRLRPPVRSAFRGAVVPVVASRSRWCRALAMATVMVLSAKRRQGAPRLHRARLPPHPLTKPTESMPHVKMPRPPVRSECRGAVALVMASRNRWYRAHVTETVMGLSAKRLHGVLRLHRVPSPLPPPALTGSMPHVKMPRPPVRSECRGAVGAVVASRSRWCRAPATETAMGLSARGRLAVLVAAVTQEKREARTAGLPLSLSSLIAGLLATRRRCPCPTAPRGCDLGSSAGRTS